LSLQLAQEAAGGAGPSRFDDSGRLDDSSGARLDDSMGRFDETSSTADESQEHISNANDDDGEKSGSSSPPISQINKFTAAMLAGKSNFKFSPFCSTITLFVNISLSLKITYSHLCQRRIAKS